MKAALLVFGVATACSAQSVAPASAPSGSAASPQVSFDFERVGLAVPKFTIVIHEDGTGTYQAQMAPVSGGGAGTSTAGSPVNRPIHISQPTTETIFKMARALDRFNIECASKAKNIADTGKKVLSYSGADGQGSCHYNYSENRSVAQLTDMFYGIAFTMDEGRKLDFMHRFDRLGLYSEIDALGREVEEKRALELENIASSLKSIIADEALIQKVRERAAKLLAQAEETDAR
jgi:hypothetical protein